jgi:starch synthase
VPSRFEPCGLTQLYGLRYGTLPLVRRVGGLADTVTDADEGGGRGSGGAATGFVFDRIDGDALADAALRAHEVFGRRDAWRRMMGHAMARDVSWREPAAHYAQLYAEVARR